jgi:hypothetical protein
VFGISDIWFYQIITGVGIIGAVTLIYISRNRGGYFAVFLKKVSTTYCKITTVRFSSIDKTLRFGKKTFTPELKNIAFRDDTARLLGSKVVCYFDYDTGKQMSFQEFKSAIDPDDLDLMVSRNIIAQLVSRLNMMGGTQLLMLIVMIVVGLLGGFIIGQFVHLGGTTVVVPANNGTGTA